MTIPSPTMQAVLLTGHGDTDRLVLGSVPIPSPRAGEVLVRLGAAAVNNTDINLRVGWYSKTVEDGTEHTAATDAATADAGWTGNAMRFPVIQGADGVGRIAAVGAGVAADRIGERVLIDPILRATGSTRYFGSDTPGSFADFTVVPAQNAVPITSPLMDRELASFPCSSLAALHMVTRAGVRSGQRVLVTGASGGVGTAAVQWCVARGASVIAVTEQSKRAALLKLGAEQTVHRGEPLGDHIPASTLDAVLDVVGGAGVGERLDALAPHGHYATAGAIAGPTVSIDLRTVYLKDLTLHGCTIPPVGLFVTLVRAIEAGEIRPLVAATYPLRELASAQQAFVRKAHLGKITIAIGTDVADR